MTPSETAELLGTIQAFDRRTVGEADIMAWHVTLADVALADARAAVLEHFSSSKDWLMPSDIKAIITATRRRRIGAVEAVTPPWQLADNPAGEQRWVSNYRHAVADGMPQEGAIAKANYLAGIEDDPEPLAIESGAADSIKAQMDANLADLVRKQSLRESEAREKADEKRERYRRIRESEAAAQTTISTHIEETA